MHIISKSLNRPRYSANPIPQAVSALIWMMLILWMNVIFWFSSQDAKESSRQSGAVLQQLQHHGAAWLDMYMVRKLAHFGAYMVLSVLMLNVVRLYTALHKKIVVWSIALSALYAVSDEVHQLFITGRSSELRDVLIDTVGAGSGILLYYVTYHYIMRFRSATHPERTIRS